MIRIEQVISVVDVVDVALIGIGPLTWPDIDNLKPIARVLETRPVIYNDRTVDDKRVLAAEVRSELLLWNSAPTVSSRGRCTARFLATLLMPGLTFLGPSALPLLDLSIL